MVRFQVTFKLVNLSERASGTLDGHPHRLSVLWSSQARQEEEHWLPPEACWNQTDFCQVCQRQACCCVVYLGSVLSSERDGRFRLACYFGVLFLSLVTFSVRCPTAYDRRVYEKLVTVCGWEVCCGFFLKDNFEECLNMFVFRAGHWSQGILKGLC